MIYLMRHGEIESSGEKRYVGQWDICLSEKGIDWAKKWHDQLKNVHFDRIITSDLSRTRETARIIKGNRPVPIEEIKAFREIDLGSWDRQAISFIKKRYPNDWKKRGDNFTTFRPPGGESFLDLQDRSFPAFEKICKCSHMNILMVAHAGINRVLLCKILGIPLENLFKIEQGYSCLNTVQYSNLFKRNSSCSWKITAINSYTCSKPF